MLKFQAIAEKTAKNFRGLLFLAETCRKCISWAMAEPTRRCRTWKNFPPLSSSWRG